MMQNMYQKKKSDLPDFKYLRREVMKVQNYCLNCKNRLPPLCMIINTGNYHSEVQLKTQVGKFPVYCLRCILREVKNTFIISLDSDSETEKENRIPDNETDFQTDLNTENELPHVAVSNETADKENSAIPTTLQESPSTSAKSTELQVSALNADNETEFQTGLNTENVEESPSKATISTELQESALNDTKVTPRRSGRKTKQTPPLLYYYRILKDSSKRRKLDEPSPSTSRGPPKKVFQMTSPRHYYTVNDPDSDSSS